MLTLERSLGTGLGKDEELWDTGAFAAGVYPDLPIAGSWGELLTHAFGRSVYRLYDTKAICHSHSTEQLLWSVLPRVWHAR